MLNYPLTTYMIVLILIISAFLLIYSISVLKNNNKKSRGQIRKSNGLFLFCITAIILCGMVILGENNPSNKEKLNIGEYSIEVEKQIDKINAKNIDKNNTSVYHNNKLGFLLLPPSTKEFNPPLQTSYIESFLKDMLFETHNNNLNAFLRFRSNKGLLSCLFKSYELNTTKDIASCLIPIHKAGLFSNLLQFNYSIQFNNKVENKIEITNNSSLPFENFLGIKDNAIIDTSKIGFPDIKDFQFQSYLNVIVFDKNEANNEDKKINAANFLLMGANSLFQNIEKIVSNENHILLCGNLTFKNVLVNGKQADLIINRWFRLIDTNSKFYVIEIAHSPQFDEGGKAWDELKKSFESFKIIDKL